MQLPAFIAAVGCDRFEPRLVGANGGVRDPPALPPSCEVVRIESWLVRIEHDALEPPCERHAERGCAVDRGVVDVAPALAIAGAHGYAWNKR